MGTILGSIFAALLGKILAWFKQAELEEQAALAQELKQHIESLAAASAAASAVDAAVSAHQAATAQVTDLQAQLDEIRRWNDKSAYLKVRAKELQRARG